mmetsp:Transcript_5362/g.10111  ORF Transcript_5362/g.10111 Transcript_5362/m.10111 type:complete len:318 (-) Transcript_5362:60-1013(-)|eukprot:CAMPEP_0114229462 /NCGR_PEP_ID=MMETSP0058-20121206/2918_1 /TAXON_ID=36894 /ORGANISM="Pyramimonas parkeae, CCMP726" /LENGTH=317 /DNA_ID=CAMNT_0001340535 /DNA_START=124 /DNA_END=1077 /DNA_ORIENTATION=+
MSDRGFHAVGRGKGKVAQELRPPKDTPPGQGHASTSRPRVPTRTAPSAGSTSAPKRTASRLPSKIQDGTVPVRLNAEEGRKHIMAEIQQSTSSAYAHAMECAESRVAPQVSSGAPLPSGSGRSVGTSTKNTGNRAGLEGALVKCTAGRSLGPGTTTKRAPSSASTPSGKPGPASAGQGQARPARGASAELSKATTKSTKSTTRVVAGASGRGGGRRLGGSPVKGRPGSTFYMGTTGEDLRSHALQAAEERVAAAARDKQAAAAAKEAAERLAEQAAQLELEETEARRAQNRSKLQQRAQQASEKCRQETAGAWTMEQ